MKYRKFIEEKFLIDEPKSGMLVPFKFNPVQDAYYEDLQRQYNIEKYGTNVAIRENITKARREGFSSLILALFAADDILTENATETDVLSYKDDATKKFLQRYRTYVLSYHAPSFGLSREEAAVHFTELEQIAKHIFETDSSDITHAHNHAHFKCDTAGARVGGRGGVMQKVLFSEIAFYQDTDKIRAAEMVEATMRQVDIDAGWIFMESTENGPGTYQHKTWVNAKKGVSRFTNRFYGAGQFYKPKEIEVIKSEYVDMEAFRRDYPMTEDDLFRGSTRTFTTTPELEALVELESAEKEICFWLQLNGTNYIDQAEIIHNTLEMLEKTHKGHALYAGIDVAKIHDATVMTVLKDKRRDLRGGIKCVTIDATGIGDFLPDWFENNSRYYTLKVKFSRSTKDIMYKNLQVILSDKTTSLPLLEQSGEPVSEEAGEFKRQMLELEKELIGEMLVVHHPKDTDNHDSYADGFHDDYPDSWILAEHGYVHINGLPERKKPPKTATLQNNVARLLNRPMQDRGKYGGTEFE